MSCMNLKHQKDPFLQSLAEKVNNSFAVVMCPAFKCDRVRVRLQWIGNSSICIGIKAKYLFPAQKIIIHGTPDTKFLVPPSMNDAIPKEDIGWSNPFRYLLQKWEDDPTNTAKFDWDDGALYDQPNARKKLLRDVIHEDDPMFCHFFTHWIRTSVECQRFDDWVNEMFAEDLEFHRDLMRYSIRFIYHDHSTPAVKALRKMQYIEDDVVKIQNNLKGITDLGYPRYDRLHPRLIFHYFKNEDFLLDHRNKLWRKLLDNPHSIILIHSLCTTTYHRNYWKANNTQNSDGFNVIFPGQMSQDVALLQAQRLRDVAESLSKRPGEIPKNDVKAVFQESVMRVLLIARQEIIVSAATLLRSTVKSKMQKTVGLIPIVAQKVWVLLGEIEDGESMRGSNQKLTTLMQSVTAMVGNELKLKIPNEKMDSRHYFQFWFDFATCVMSELMQQHWKRVLRPELNGISARLSGQSIDRMLFETILYWKSIDLRFDPSYNVHVIALSGLRNTQFNGSEEQERVHFESLAVAMGCSELIHEELVRWNYHE